MPAKPLSSGCSHSRAGTFKPKSILAMVLVSIALIAECVRQIIVIFQQLEAVNERQIKLEAMSNGTLYHHEAMTSAAQMYTLSALPRWQSQYKSAKHMLGQDLIEIRLHSPEHVMALNDELEAASRKLQQVEEASFRLMQQGAPLQGLDLLGGADYVDAKAVFGDKLMLLEQDMNEANLKQEDRLREGMAGRLAALGAVMVTLLLMWSVCLRLMVRWERRMLDSDALTDDVESKLHLQSRVLDNILNNLPVGLFAKDIRNNYLYSICNKKAEELFEISAAKLLGSTDFDHFPLDEATFFRQTDEKVVSEGRVIEVDVEEVTSPRGTWLAHTVKVPIYEDAGQPSMLVGIFEDVTIKKYQADIQLQAQSSELELNNQALDAACKRAEATDIAKAEFLAAMSTRLGTPLAAIADAADHLLKAELSGRAGGHVRTIRKCAGLLLFTLKDMAELGNDPPQPITPGTAGTGDALADISAEKRARLQESFRDSASACLTELEQAALFGDAARFRRAAHQLKGAAATFGYVRLQEIADKAEHEPDGNREALVAQIWTEFVRSCEGYDAESGALGRNRTGI